MNEENKLIKILIPVIAVVIIFESVVLVSNLNKNNTKTVTQVSKSEEASQSTKANSTQSVIDLVFATDSKEMKVGKTYKVELSMAAKDDRTLDALDTYVKYDSTLVTISGLSFNTDLPKPTLNKIDNQNGVLKSSILIDEKPGYKISKGEVVKIMSFNVTPKKVGSFNLEVSTGNEYKSFATMLVESVTSQAVPFSSNKLEINVLK
jgi:hypothetical protein